MSTIIVFLCAFVVFGAICAVSGIPLFAAGIGAGIVAIVASR